MDLSKKRKTGESSSQFTTAVPDDVTDPPRSLYSLGITPQDARKILERLSKDQLVDVLQTVVVRDVAVLDTVRAIADFDTTLRKLFIRSVGPETTTENLRSVFSAFGELEDAVVVTDKATGKSKGYGFVTFKHIDGAILALKEPNKKIDGRLTVAQLAAVRDSGGIDVSMRKIYIANVPFEISPERLLNYFSSFGEIEEGPLGFDKQLGKPKGFAFFIYKTEEGAKSSLVDPVKNIDGHHVICKLATDGKKAKVGGPQGSIGMPVDAVPLPRSMPGSMNSGYGMPGGLTSFSGFSGGPSLRFHQNPQNSSMPLALGGGPGFGNQGPPSFGGGGGSGGQHAEFGYGSGPGEHPGVNNYGSSMNRLPLRVGAYPDVGKYGLSLAYQSQLPPAGARGPLGGRFQGGPPFH